MELIVATECRFLRDANGRTACADGTYGYRFWQRYLDEFDGVTVVARCDFRQTVDGIPVEGDAVRVFALPDSRGVMGALTQRGEWKSRLRTLADRRAAFCLRLPGMIGGLLGHQLQRSRIPYGAEIVGDPADVFARGAYRHRLRPLIRSWYCRQLTQLCRQADVTAYVTRSRLQAKYPPARDGYSTSYSSINLPDQAIRGRPRPPADTGRTCRFVSVGTMSQRYKGYHLLLAALEQGRRAGLDWRLTLVGDGRYRSQLEDQTRVLNLQDAVTFTGRLAAGAQVFTALDASDVFVLPSLADGLPRAVIEAQARGLPCLASRVGGIPELLGESEMFPPNNVPALVAAMQRLAGDSHRMSELSRNNIRRAQEYSATRMQLRRAEFCHALHRVSRPRTTGMAA